jgi:hypothetical protein
MPAAFHPVDATGEGRKSGVIRRISANRFFENRDLGHLKRDMGTRHLLRAETETETETETAPSRQRLYARFPARSCRSANPRFPPN